MRQVLKDVTNWGAVQRTKPEGLPSPPSWARSDPTEEAPSLAVEWYYLDLQGIEQGPFSTDDMHSWVAHGHLQAVQARKATDITYTAIEHFTELNAQQYTQLKHSLTPLLAQLLQAPEPTSGDESASLQELAVLLQEVTTAVRARCAQRPVAEGCWQDVETDLSRAIDELSIGEEEKTADIADSNAAEILLGDLVHFKLPNRTVRQGIVTAADHKARTFTIDADGETFGSWPAKSVVKKKCAAPQNSAAAAAKVKFEIKKKAAAVVSSVHSAPAAAHSEENTTAAPPQIPQIPRRPRLVVAIDTNEMINVAASRLDRRHLLQDCDAVDILLPRQVVDELDGLKLKHDVNVAASARRANALLSEAGRKGERWLLYEKQPIATAANHSNLAADERILKCVLDFQQFPERNKMWAADRLILATSDRNLQLRAMMAGVEAKPLMQIRQEAMDRDKCWRAAYCNQLASNALESACWSHTPADGSKGKQQKGAAQLLQRALSSGLTKSSKLRQ